MKDKLMLKEVYAKNAKKEEEELYDFLMIVLRSMNFLRIKAMKAQLIRWAFDLLEVEKSSSY